MLPILRFFTIAALLCLALGAFADEGMSLRSAIRFGELDRVTEVLKADPAQARELDEKGRTPLHDAAGSSGWGDAQATLQTAGALVDGGVPVNARAYDGSTPLHAAVEDGIPEMIAFLLKKGADVNARDDAGKTPLCLAFERQGDDQAAKIKALLDGGVNPNLADDKGVAPLHLAAERGKDSTATVKLLLGKGAKTDVRNHDGETPLHLAKDVAAATALLDAGADMNAKDEKGRTALFAAAQASMELLTLFLQRGADLHAVGPMGATLMHGTASGGGDAAQDRARIKFLQDKGLSVNATDAAGRTPLYYATLGEAVFSAFFGGMPSFSERTTSVDLLLAAGANPNIADNRGWTPLHIAAFANQERLVKALLGKKAGANARTKAGMTPLHLACRKGFVGKEELAGVGAMLIPDEIMTDLTESDQQGLADGMSVLFGSSVKAGAVGLLVKAGADLHGKDAAGRTPLGVALQSGFTEAQQMLQAAGAPAEQAPAEVLTLPDASALQFKSNTVTGNTPLHRAVARGETEKARQLLAKGAGVNARNSAGETPLHLACRAEQAALEIINLLLQGGAEVSAVDEAGETPLHNAAQAGRLELVTALLGKQALVGARDNNGRTPLHLAATAEVASALVKAGATLEDRDECGRTPLAGAAMAGNAAAVEALLGLGANLRAVDEKGGTLLHAAALSQDEHAGAVIALLLAKDLDPNAKDVMGRTPLYLAASWGRIYAVDGLLAGKADLNAGEKNGGTPLQASLMSNMQLDGTDVTGAAKEQQPTAEDRTAVMKRLLDGGANVNGKGQNGVTPLLCAISGENTDGATLLLDRGAQVNGADDDGDTPLHYAAGGGDAEIINLLVARGAQINARNKKGQMPLHKASGYGILVSAFGQAFGGEMDSGMRHLLRKGADANAKDNDGNTPLHVAVTTNAGDTVIALARLLLQNKANINAKNNEGQTPLLAVLSGWVGKETAPILTFLLDRGADPNLADKEGKTPLIAAAGLSEDAAAPCVKALLKKKNNVNAKDAEGSTALHIAVERGNVAVVKLLVAAGANPDVKNAAGRTPRVIAKEKKNAALTAALTPPKKK